MYWYLITGLLLFGAAFVARWSLGFSWPALGLNLRGSLLGVTLAHGLTNVALFLVVPFLLG